MVGTPAGFNPAGWISWIVGFAVGAFNLVVDWLLPCEWATKAMPHLADWKDYVPVPPVAAMVVGFVLYLVLSLIGVAPGSWRCPRRPCENARERCRRFRKAHGLQPVGFFCCSRVGDFASDRTDGIRTIHSPGRVFAAFAAASSPESAGAYRRAPAWRVARGSLLLAPGGPRYFTWRMRDRP